ncbi:MAG: fatty acid desaturase family protein [Rhodothermales bacterium]
MVDRTHIEHFPLGEAKKIVQDLFVRKPLIYWVDFLISVTLGWSAFVLTLTFPTFSPGQLVFYLIATLALYRALIFTHELAHMKRSAFRLFRIIWNVICGFPLMTPSFTYHGVHIEHHRSSSYGLEEDGEYLPLAIERPYKIILYVLLSFVLPIVFAGRFILLAPLSYLHKRLRTLVWRYASSLAIDLRYNRSEPSAQDRKDWRIQEGFTFLYGATVIVLVVTGVLTYKVLVLWYLIAVLIFMLNSLRTLAAHCYLNPGDRVMAFAEQYLDSVNVPGNRFLTALWAPVGLRFHATHHLFPSMPYHALGEAHRRLIAELPDNSLYLETTRKSLWDALRRLWKDARAHTHADAALPA